jgi:hypothetical protein
MIAPNPKHENRNESKQEETEKTEKKKPVALAFVCSVLSCSVFEL